MKKYDSYKDSGVKWLGEIPSHWEMERWRFLMYENVKKNSDCKVRLQLQFRYGDIVRKNNQSEESDVLDTISKYTVVEPNDIMINGLNLNYDFVSQRVARVQEEGVITSAYISLRPTLIANSRYYTYFLKSLDSKKMFHGMGTGIRLTLSYNELKNQFIPKPSLQEQEAIANYLDSATSKIDEAIAQQQKMIDLLNERKQIIINNAVTKGLDPNVKMKDSGVDYIEQIPSSWDIRRTASLGRFAKGGNISRDDLREEGKPAILYGDIYTKYNIFAQEITNHVSSEVANSSVRIYNGDLLMTGSGETKEDIGKTIVFEGEEAYIGGDVILFRQSGNNSKFLSYALNSQYAKDFRYRESKGEIVVHIYANAIRRLYLAVPNIEEQELIVEYLDKNLEVINSEIDVIQNQISLLQERKQIIINDVVTGKVKVI